MTQSEFDDMLLNKVVTVPEVCHLWHCTPKTVMMAIYKDKFVARQVEGGAAWLILRSSVIKAWGQPRERSKREKLEQPRC